MKRLRLAVVGTGRLGRIHARLASQQAEAELVAVVDADRAAAAEVAAETGCRPLAHLRELFGDVDAAIVATPTSTHLSVAGELIRGGVHVLVEKPLAPTTADADALNSLARRHHLVLQTGHVERFNPALQAALPSLRDVRFVEARRTSGYTFRSLDVGVVMDLMIHDIDVVLSLIDAPVTRIDAAGAAVLSGDCEDMASARLQFANGAVAALSASRVSYVNQRVMQVFTPACAATIDFASRKATAIEPTAQVLAGAFDPLGIPPTERARLQEQMFETLLVRRELPIVDLNALAEEQRDFVAAIRTGRAPRVTGADGRNAVAVAEAITAAIEEFAAAAPTTATRRRTAAARPPAARLAPPPIDAVDISADDTVILRRKAG